MTYSYIFTEVLSDGIARIRIGAEQRSELHSYLPARDWPGGKNLDVMPSADGRALDICDASGIPRLRLPFSDIRAGQGVRLRLAMLADQHFHGLGEGGQQFDRIGATRRLWTSQGNHGQGGADLPIPLLLGTSGIGLFFDNSSRGQLVAGDSITGTGIEYMVEDGPLDLYVITGDNPRQLLERATDVLGRAPMPPRWALGFMQSTRHFDSAAEMLSVTRTMRARKLPCDAFIFLSTYGIGHGWNRGVGHLQFQPDLVPDPKAVLGEMRAAHFQVFIHEYPVLHEDSPLHAEAVTDEKLLDFAYPDLRPHPPCTVAYREGQRFLDFSRAEVRRWWWEAHRDLVALDIAGWWLDGGEGPDAAAVLQGGSGLALHNRYDLLRQQAFAEGEARDNPDRRVFLLCRSGGAGMQRFGAACWSGDVDASFPTLEAQVQIGLNLGLSGVPYWGTDIGGFYQVGAVNPELFARWFAYGAFCPIFRAHGHVWRDHLPWSHGPEIEKICRRYLELRYRLMPYTYTMAWQAHRLGLPLMRPLLLNYPRDRRFQQLGSEYLWGDDLLVAPVTREGATHWPVTLPEGTWHDFWTHEAHHGPGAVTVAAPLDRLPLFVRAGAIVPFGPPMQYANEKPADEISLLVYPAGRGTFELYEDDGRSNAYRDGAFALTRFTCTADASGVVFEVAAAQGDARQIPPGRHFLLRLHASRAPREVNGTPSTWSMDDEGFLGIRFTTQPARIEVVW